MVLLRDPLVSQTPRHQRVPLRNGFGDTPWFVALKEHQLSGCPKQMARPNGPAQCSTKLTEDVRLLCLPLPPFGVASHRQPFGMNCYHLAKLLLFSVTVAGFWGKVHGEKTSGDPGMAKRLEAPGSQRTGQLTKAMPLAFEAGKKARLGRGTTQLGGLGGSSFIETNPFFVVVLTGN